MLLLTLLSTMLAIASSTVLTLAGGQITINGAITATYVDFFVNFTANVQWMAMIWSQNQADTDVTLFKSNSASPTNPVILTDCHLDQNSYIQSDNIQNLMTSITGFYGNIDNGIIGAFKRDLVTGDTQDITIYADSVIQVCFITSTLPFVGNGHQTGNQKSCTYLSLHRNINYLSDRLLGNFAATTTFGGGNLTVYATQSTDNGNFQSWLFLTVVHRVQGLNPFSPKWLGVTYSNTLTNNDLAIIEYDTIGVELDIHISDYYSINSSFAGTDYSFTVNQGNNDISTVMTAYDPTGYMIGSFKRKLATGDINRDIDVPSGDNTFCVIYGTSLAFSTFSQTEQFCFNFNLVTEYSSNFRQSSSTSVNVQPYQTPPNTVLVVTVGESFIKCTVMILLLMGFA